ncbi:LamG domain-containing protein [Streptomyces halstedii]|uniref:LamG domain-containing protein n=1 Tax=Streptomyces halstedii TaxID=1944 RepID=UPI0037D1CE98
MAYSDVVLADSPSIYFRYTGNSLVANSGSKTGISVTSSGGITWTSGLLGGEAPRFAGTGSASRINYNLNPNTVFNTSSWSLEVWFKLEAGRVTHSDIVQTFDTNNELALFVWEPTGTDANKLKVFHKGSGGTRQTFTSTIAFTDTNWHHVVVVKEGAPGTLRVYIDGVQNGTVPSQVNNYTSSTPFRIAAYGDSSNNENFLGAIDEVAVYGSALSSARVSAHYTAGITPAGPLTLEAGFPASVSFAGTLGYTLAITDPVVPPLTLEAGFPAVANFAGVLGYTLEIKDGPTYRYLDTELVRKRTSVTLGSRSIDVELARKRINMEVKK